LSKKEEKREERKGDCTKVFLLGIFMVGLLVIWDEALTPPNLE